MNNFNHTNEMTNEMTIEDIIKSREEEDIILTQFIDAQKEIIEKSYFIENIHKTTHQHLYDNEPSEFDKKLLERNAHTYEPNQRKQDIKNIEYNIKPIYELSFLNQIVNVEYTSCIDTFIPLMNFHDYSTSNTFEINNTNNHFVFTENDFFEFDDVLVFTMKINNKIIFEIDFSNDGYMMLKENTPDERYVLHVDTSTNGHEGISTNAIKQMLKTSVGKKIVQFNSYDELLGVDCNRSATINFYYHNDFLFFDSLSIPIPDMEIYDKIKTNNNMNYCGKNIIGYEKNDNLHPCTFSPKN